MTDWSLVAQNAEKRRSEEEQRIAEEKVQFDSLERRSFEAIRTLKLECARVIAEYNSHISRDDIKMSIMENWALGITIKVGQSTGHRREVNFSLMDSKKIYIKRSNEFGHDCGTLNYEITISGDVEGIERMADLKRSSMTEIAETECLWLANTD